ncbi:6314_t:CDS:2 [Paraglomus occultum]|uniref:6314_t:CDS:1 n=1 Tax=Paraglomus occultum TaxID=144539 RepID=A0A9N9GLC6_9GLOM|nr:6314_t:CDS:2 [Paraglomus occultum]
MSLNIFLSRPEQTDDKEYDDDNETSVIYTLAIANETFEDAETIFVAEPEELMILIDQFDVSGKKFKKGYNEVEQLQRELNKKLTKQLKEFNDTHNDRLKEVVNGQPKKRCISWRQIESSKKGQEAIEDKSDEAFENKQSSEAVNNDKSNPVTND